MLPEVSLDQCFACFAVVGPKTGFAYSLRHLLTFLEQMVHVHPPRQVFCWPFTLITTRLCKDDDGRSIALTVGCTSAIQDAMCTTLVLTSRAGV